MAEDKIGLVNKILVGIGSLLILSVIVFFIVSSVSDVYTTFDPDTTNSSSQVILTSATATLSPIGKGITSSEVKAYNNSWMNFDAINDYIVVGGPAPWNTFVNLTISFWINPYEVGGDDYAINYYGSASDAWGIRVDTNNNVEIADDIDDANVALYPTSVGVGKWVHAVAIMDGLENKLYVNGTLVGNGTNSTDTWSSFNGTLFVGSRLVGGNYFGGSIDELRIYNQSLSDGNISAIYSSGRQANSSLPSDGLVLWYSFDEQTGTTVYDKSGNGNHGE